MEVMKEVVKNSLIINEEKSIKNTLLYISNVDVNSESYEAKILSEENIENIIKYQTVYDGENKVLKYDVTNSISLDEHLKHTKFKKQDICNILIAIDEVLLSIENYLLSENSIVLNSKLVRVIINANKSITYKFIAIPNYKSDFSYELSKFLISLLRHVDVDDKEALSLAYGLFVRSSKDNYTINDLMELINMASDKHNILNQDFSIEDLTRYDEDMASEISEEIIEENRQKMIDEIPEDITISNTVLSDNTNGLVMDIETKNLLGESILNDFDKEDRKIINKNEKSFLKRKGKALKGHISFSIIGYILAPIAIIALPLIYFFVIT